MVAQSIHKAPLSEHMEKSAAPRVYHVSSSVILGSRENLNGF